MPLPESIIVNTSLSDNNELKGNETAVAAFYSLTLSQKTRPVFFVREISVRQLLESRDIRVFEGTTIHEMFHAADHFMLMNHYQLAQTLDRHIQCNEDHYQGLQNDRSIALLHTLRMFNHYRAEGIAIVGESLLQKKPVAVVGNPIARFQSNFLRTVMISCDRADGIMTSIHDEENISRDAYIDAPFILLFVLLKQGLIEKALAQKAIYAMSKGRFDLTDQEIHIIMHCAIDLPLSSYIEGLIMLGEEVAPIRPFLFLCGKIQQDIDDSYTDALSQLIQKTESADVFRAAMKQIMGSLIQENELDRLYDSVMNEWKVDTANSQIKEKLTELYSVLKKGDNTDNKMIAQWALTYFFDDEDVIHDRIPGLGLIDDMIVIDYALRLVRR